MGDDSRKIKAAEVAHPPAGSFQHNDWNQLYDIVAHEYFVPMDSRIPGIGGKCYWPRWVIVSRKLKMAQPSWYDVEKNTDLKDSNDNQPSASLSLAASFVASTTSPHKTTPSTFRRQSRRSVTEEKNRRPSRAVKNLIQSYAELPREDEIITIEDDDEEELPPPKRLRGETLIHNKVTIQWSSESTYALHFPSLSTGLGLHVYEEGASARFDRLARPFDFAQQPQPQKGDVLTSVNGVSVEQMSYEQVKTMLTENPGTQPSIVGFKRAPLIVTMDAQPNPNHDYVLRFPPRSEGVGLCLSKEGDLTCFAQLLRPADFGINSPPGEGDSVATIDGKVVGELGYDGIRQILAENGGKSVCLVGFRRKQPDSDPGTTKLVSENEYDLHLPVTTKGLGIRIRSDAGHVIFEKIYRRLTADSQVTPKKGDVIVGIDGADAVALDYEAVLGLLRRHKGRSERIIRFRKNFVTKGIMHNEMNGGNGTTQQAFNSGVVTGTQGPAQMAGAKQNGLPSRSFGPAQPTNATEFEVEVRSTRKGPGILVSQSGRKAVFERFREFAQLMGGTSPARGDEIVAIDGIPVRDFQYHQIVENLKNSKDGQRRTIRFRKKSH